MANNKPPKPSVGCKDFWKKPSTSLSRSAILIHRLIFDLQFSASKTGYLLEVYKGEVDQNGFDIILDDQETLCIRKVQVKTVFSKSSTHTWKIHRTMLRPSPFHAETLGFEFSPLGTGYQGAVILMEFKPNNDLMEIDYYFTDNYILCAFDSGVLSKNTKKHITNLFAELRNGTSHQKVTVCKSAFVKAKGPDHLLALLGLHGPMNDVNWPNSLLSYIKEKNDMNKSNASNEIHKLID